MSSARRQRMPEAGAAGANSGPESLLHPTVRDGWNTEAGPQAERAEAEALLGVRVAAPPLSSELWSANAWTPFHGCAMGLTRFSVVKATWLTRGIQAMIAMDKPQFQISPDGMTYNEAVMGKSPSTTSSRATSTATPEWCAPSDAPAVLFYSAQPVGLTLRALRGWR
jgi:hypothetical protein